MKTNYTRLSYPLKHCPFCGSVAKRTGGCVGDIEIRSCRCSNDACLASFKSVDYETWNTRSSARDANKTTKGISYWYGEEVKISLKRA